MSFPCFFAIFVTVKSKQMAGNDCCIKRSAIILGAFMLFFVLWYFNIAVRPFEGCIGSSQTLHYTLNYLLAGLIPSGALFLLHARRDIASSMGLSHDYPLAVECGSTMVRVGSLIFGRRGLKKPVL